LHNGLAEQTTSTSFEYIPPRVHMYSKHTIRVSLS